MFFTKKKISQIFRKGTLFLEAILYEFHFLGAKDSWWMERNREYILPSLEISKMLWGDRQETCQH